MGDKRKVSEVVIRKLEGKRSLGTPRYVWEDNIGMYVKGKGGNMWIGFVWLRMGSSRKPL
jgi:hypothetical protein